jgi:hypothetical protein
MKRIWIAVALLVATTAGVGEAAAPAAPAPKPAPAPAPPPADRLAMARGMSAVSCDTDGGPVGCSDAVHFLGSAFTWTWNNPPGASVPVLSCGPGKRVDVKVSIMYEYNDGTWEFYDSDAKKAKWPPCIREKLQALATPILKDLWTKIHDMDGSIDVRARWTLHLSLE